MKLKRKFDEFRYWLACCVSPWVADVDYRFSCVLCDVTEGMSKTNYSLEAMRQQIGQKFADEAEMAIDDFLDDYEDDEILRRATEVRERNKMRRERALRAQAAA